MPNAHYMKKYIVSLLAVFFIFPVAVFASGETVTQSSLYTGEYQFSNNEGSSANRGYFFSDIITAHGDVNTYGIGNVLWPGNRDFSTFGHGTYHLILSSNSDGSCTSMTYTACKADILLNGFTYTDYLLYYNVAPNPNTMGDLITAANAGFASTTGFSVDSVTTWAGDNLIKLFIGSGLAVLYSLRYWIVALITIGAIVYFAYRALRFYKH